MKKLSIIALAVAAVALWACSKSGPAADPATAWMFDETLPVPIQLGGGDGFSVYTKAAQKVTSLDVIDGNGNNYLYVYAVDLHLGTDPDAEGWDETLNYCKEHAIEADQLTTDDYLFGVNSNKPTPLKASVDPGTGRIVFADGTRYYPYSETKKMDDGRRMHMGKNYSFIAFNTPNMSNSSYKPELITAAGKTRLVKRFSLKPGSADYDKDVLWARVDAEPGRFPDELEKAADNEANDGYFRGYNARYMRKLANLAQDNSTDTEYPELKFQHAVSMIHIIVKAEEGAEATINDSGLKVNNLKVNAKYTSLALDVLNGEVFPYPGQTLETSFLDLNSSVEIYPTEAGQEYSTGFFVMPGPRTESENQSVDERVTISFDIVLPGLQPSTMKVSLPLPEGQEYKAGKEYTYYLSIESPEEIVLKTSLTQWTSGASELGDQTTIPFE